MDWLDYFKRASAVVKFMPVNFAPDAVLKTNSHSPTGGHMIQ